MRTSAEQKQRLATALRENLKRRKARARTLTHPKPLSNAVKHQAQPANGPEDAAKLRH